MMTAATTYAALVDAANAQRLRLYGEEAPEARWVCEVAAPLGACTRRSRSPGAADRRQRETSPMALAGYVFPQPEVCGSEAVDCAIGQLDVDLSADHSHPAAPRGGMKVGKLRRLIHLE